MLKKLIIRLVFALILASALTGAALASQGQQTQLAPPPRMLHDRGLEAVPYLPAIALAPQELVPYAPAAIPTWTKMVFQSWRDNNDWEIYKANGDGTSQLRLTNNSIWDFQANYNRGATKIVFSSERDGNFEIYTMNADGSGVTRLTFSAGDDYAPNWSPDGTKIVFNSERTGNPEVYVMDANGNNQLNLTNYSGSDYDPDWSPDGNSIAFNSYRNGQWRIWVMDANGGNQHQINTQAYSEFPTWSPDGRQIAFDADVNLDDWMELWVMNADGSNAHMVYDPPQSQTSAWMRSWSPDGRYLSFTRISFIYQNSTWYWTTAYIDAFDTTNSTTSRLSNDGRDWNPDWATTDAAAPATSVTALPAYTLLPSFTVSWSGSDSGGSGFKSYDIQYRDGVGGAWTDWWLDVWGVSAAFPGVEGHTYYFRSRGRDNAYNLEAWPASHDAVTTVDGTAPTSAVAALPAFTNQTTFPVSWSGADAASGVQSYDVQVRDGVAGSWVDWQIAATGTTAQFSGATGHSYAFRSRARDNAGNLEAWPADADAFTIVDTIAPLTSVSPLPQFSHTPFTVSWGGIDTGDAGLMNYDLQVRDGPGGIWTDVLLGTTQTSVNFVGSLGHTFYFRSRGRDHASNLEAYPAGDGDAATTIYSWAIRGAVTDNTGVPVSGAVVTTSPAAFAAFPSDAFGAYSAYVTSASGAYTATWAKSGYGSLPPTDFAPSPDATLEVVLPPADNLVQNWGFENGAFAAGDWHPSAQFTPLVTTAEKHTGQYAAFLGTSSPPLQTGESMLTQVVALPPASSPALSFLYQLHGASPTAPSWLAVQATQGITVTTLFSTTANTPGWTHHWLDLSAWAGKTITLTFAVRETAGQPAASAFLDEVSIGAAHPDVWVEKTASARSAKPGETLTFTLTYGNRGSVPAASVRITDTLPAELTFVSASVPPVSTSPALVWEVGSLPAGSGPFTIVVTATLSLSAPPLTQVENEVEISAASPELEKLNNHAVVDVFVGSVVYLPLLQKR